MTDEVIYPRGPRRVPQDTPRSREPGPRIVEHLMDRVRALPGYEPGTEPHYHYVTAVMRQQATGGEWVKRSDVENLIKGGV